MNSHSDECFPKVSENEDIENSGAINSKRIYESTKSRCSICQVGKLVRVERGNSKKVLVYGRNGTFLAQHNELRCNFQTNGKSCPAGHFHGYTTYRGDRIYDDDALKNEVLMITGQTGFTIEYLVELSGSIEINASTFEGLSKLYNRIHNGKLPYDVLSQRIEICRKRISDAYFLFAYLELGQRYMIKNYQIILKGDLDLSIEKHREEFQVGFREKWSMKHV